MSRGATESAADASGGAARAAEAAPHDRAVYDSAVTLDRHELKYLVPAAHLGGFVRALRAHLRPHRFTGQGANLLPDAQHFTTTVYYDTPSHALLRAARAEPERNVKLRAREYYDMHSSLAELATDPGQIVRHQPWVFMELKHRTGTRTSKHRLRLRRSELDTFFSGADEAPHDAERAAIRSFAADLGEPLVPSCVVNYRRVALEDEAGALRVTLDVELAFFVPPVGLWTRGPLVRGNLGAPCAAPFGCLLEIKLRDETPAWLARALEQAHAKSEHISKFLLASEAIHGKP